MAVVQVVGRRRCIGGMATTIESKSICASTTSSTTGAAVDHNAAGQNSGSLDARLLGRSSRHSQRAGNDGHAHGTHHCRSTPARPNVPARRSTRSRTRNEALMMSSTGSVDRRWFVGTGLVRKRCHGRSSARSSGGSNRLLVRITTRIAAGGIGGGGGGWEQKILAAGGHGGRFLLLGGGGGSAHHFPLPGQAGGHLRRGDGEGSVEATRLLAASAITAGVARVGTAKGGVMAVAVASRSRCCCGIRGTHFGRSFFVAGAAEQKERTSLLFVDRYSTVVRVLVTGASLASTS